MKPPSDSSQLTIPAILAMRAELNPQAIAIETETGNSLNYAIVAQVAGRLAQDIAGSIAEHQGKRRRVGILLSNGAGLALALLGASASGQAVPFNPASKAAELETYFQITNIDALILSESDTGPASEIAAKLKIPVLRFSSDYRLDRSGANSVELFEPEPDDIALVLMTSGSTGRPKIVPLSHRNVCTSAGDVCRSMALGPDDVCLSMWEQYHIGGLVDLLLAPLSSGGRVIMTKGFSAENFFRLVSEKRPTWFQGVPTTLRELVFYQKQHSLSTQPNSLRLVRSVAAALDPALMLDLERIFGVPVIQTFGMTEAGPLITSTSTVSKNRKPRSVGRSCGPEIRVVGESGQTLGANEVGEIGVRGANVFTGYENDADANRAQFRNGWFHTGDIGFLDDDGELFLTGRIKQLINRGGEKISPQEIDDVLLEHPAIAEAAAFAIQHRTLGEDIAAAVALSSPTDLDSIRGFLSSRLASFKQPSRILVLDRLPRNPVGKIDRLALAEMAAKDPGPAEHAHPKDPLEALLIQLWSKELGVREVGLSDQFSSLGGDSLSSLRILIAIETALGVGLPDDSLAHFSTVATLAEQLRKAGIRLAENKADDRASLSAIDAQKVLSSVDVGIAPLNEPAETLIGALDACQNEIEFRVIADKATLYRSPAELLGLVKMIKIGNIGVRASNRVSLLKLYRLRLAAWRWKRRIFRELSTFSASMNWRRQVLPGSMNLYEAANEPSNKTLLIGFAGNYMRLMVPTYRILGNLDPARTDLLLLSDPSKTCFLNGLDEVGDSLDALGEYLKEFQRKRGYKQVAAIGTSGGGLPAIYLSISNSWKRAVAVGCASLDRHLEFIPKFTEIASSPKLQGTRIVLAYSSKNVRDHDAVNQITSIFPNAQLSPDARFEQHNLINEVDRRGELKDFLDSRLFSDRVM